MKKPVMESLFNKDAGLKNCDFIEKSLQRRCFPVNIAKLSRTAVLKNICGWLLLQLIRLVERFSITLVTPTYKIM